VEPQGAEAAAALLVFTAFSPGPPPRRAFLTVHVGSLFGKGVLSYGSRGSGQSNPH
jgi:hypothetical protein